MIGSHQGRGGEPHATAINPRTRLGDQGCLELQASTGKDEWGSYGLCTLPAPLTADHQHLIAEHHRGAAGSQRR